MGSTWIISTTQGFGNKIKAKDNWQFLPQYGYTTMEFYVENFCWIEPTLDNEKRWSNNRCTHKVYRFLPPMVLADCDPEQV